MPRTKWDDDLIRRSKHLPEMTNNAQNSPPYLSISLYQLNAALAEEIQPTDKFLLLKCNTTPEKPMIIQLSLRLVKKPTVEHPAFLSLFWSLLGFLGEHEV